MILVVHLLVIIKIQGNNMTFVLCSLFENLYYDFFP